MLNKIKEHKILVILGVVVFLAFLIRVWFFSDLLTFKMDQARDVKLVEEAYNGGIGELPLLGPRAAKTYLRLGPVFYYFEYSAMLIFGDKPWAVAIPDFIFSILTIPLFYYFLRQAFNKKVSLMTTVVFASSFFLTQYGRFAWNPNSIPFWSILLFLSIYKVVIGYRLSIRRNNEGLVTDNLKKKLEVNKSVNNNEIRPFPRTIFLRKIVFSSRLNFLKCKNGLWLLVASLSYGVASQLHLRRCWPIH